MLTINKTEHGYTIAVSHENGGYLIPISESNFQELQGEIVRLNNELSKVCRCIRIVGATEWMANGCKIHTTGNSAE